MDQRFKLLQKWLQEELGWDLVDLRPASNDASFRRYFRASLGQPTKQPTEHQSFVIMDAPPEHEPLEPFISIARELKKQDVNSPQVYEFNHDLGFLVLQDLGNTTYLSSLREQNSEEHTNLLYQAALRSLLKIQHGSSSSSTLTLPSYDKDLINRELDLFIQWYLPAHLELELNAAQLQVWDTTKEQLVNAFLEQPNVWVHRDFHSRNLMLTYESSPGVIDFQDMLLGPIAYDLVSLFKDCYIEWPREQQLSWLNDYFNLCQINRLGVDSVTLDFSFDQLVRWYDLCGIQRHLKVLGIFCRLNYRDGKSQYIDDLSLVRKYLHEALSLYPEFSEFNNLFNELNA